MTTSEIEFQQGARLVDRSRTLSAIVRFRRSVQMAIDGLAWGVALFASLVLRYDFDVNRVGWDSFALLLVAALTLQLLFGTASGLYTGRYHFGSFEEVAALARTAVAVIALLVVVNGLLIPVRAPLSTPFTGGCFAIAMTFGARYSWRLLLERVRRPSLRTAWPTIVFGAGEGGSQLVTSMLRDRDSPYVPVALLDDDSSKRNLRIRGIPVSGTRDAMADVADRTGAKTLVVAIPSASAQTIREASALAADAGLEVRVLPAVSELLDRPSVHDIRAVTEVDLLGRHEVDTDVGAIAEYITGRRVLVTGAGGSIGSELCRQLFRFAPAELIMVDRDESALHSVQLSLHGRALLDTDDLVVADIRDQQRVAEVFSEHRPEVVFHAAALKHLPLLELHPEEAVKTNVMGTLNVLRAAMAAGVERFVNVSTDKAADPTSVLGYSKRVAERLTAWAAANSGGGYLSVRFGNVLGTRGSVLRSFRAQIEAGGPVTVTHPEVTRFFMTVEESVQLVIQAGAIGLDGEVLILDMGQPVRIAEVAQRLIEESGHEIEIVYTGLRQGEKMHEVLRSAEESTRRTVHPLISHVPVPPIEPSAIDGTDWRTDAAARLRECSTKGPVDGAAQPTVALSQS